MLTCLLPVIGNASYQDIPDSKHSPDSEYSSYQSPPVHGYNSSLDNGYQSKHNDEFSASSDTGIFDMSDDFINGAMMKCKTDITNENSDSSMSLNDINVCIMSRNFSNDLTSDLEIDIDDLQQSKMEKIPLLGHREKTKLKRYDSEHFKLDYSNNSRDIIPNPNLISHPNINTACKSFLDQHYSQNYGDVRQNQSHIEQVHSDRATPSTQSKKNRYKRSSSANPSPVPPLNIDNNSEHEQKTVLQQIYTNKTSKAHQSSHISNYENTHKSPIEHTQKSETPEINLTSITNHLAVNDQDHQENDTQKIKKKKCQQINIEESLNDQSKMVVYNNKGQQTPSGQQTGSKSVFINSPTCNFGQINSGASSNGSDQHRSVQRITPRFKGQMAEQILENVSDNLIFAIQTSIAKHVCAAFPDFIKITIKKFVTLLKEHPSDIESTMEDYMKFCLLNQRSLPYIMRDNRQSATQQLGIYTYAQAAVSHQDGIINKVKRNVIDEIRLWFNVFLNIDENTYSKVEKIIDDMLIPLSDVLTRATFQVLDTDEYLPLTKGGCLCFGRCFGGKKISKETKHKLVAGLTGVLAGALKFIVGDTLAEGAKDTAIGIWDAIAELNE